MLKIKNLTCGYNGRIILNNINFQLNAGDILGIVGPNGSGKTTLLRAITKVIKLKTGEILFRGEHIEKMSFKEIAKKIAMVSQLQDMELNIIVEDVVLAGRIPHYGRFQFLETKKDREIAHKCMALTDILNFKQRTLREISSGERQLVLIAQALAQEPELLLLDEPTTHLDIAHQVRILDLVRKLNNDLGITVIMVLHDLNLSSEYCHRLALINKGEIYKISVPEEVITYQAIEEVYKTIVVVEKNPVSFKPYVFLVPRVHQNCNM